MTTRRPTPTLSWMASLVLATTLVGCGNVPPAAKNAASSQQPTAAAKNGSSDSVPTGNEDSAPEAAPVVLTPSVEDGADGVKVSTIVSVKASSGTVSKVKLWTKGKTKDGDTETVKVPGTLSQDGSTWTASSALDPGSKYQLEMEGRNASDQVVQDKSTFTTKKLSLDDQTYPTISPAKGSKVGVGMPVILTFDVAVRNRKEFEKHLSVTSTGNQKGSWRWYGDKSVHFRPQKYWRPGTKVIAKANLNGVSAGRGIYGQKSTSTSFTVGRSVITKINLKTKRAKVYINGKLARTIPVSGGKAGWRSRSGTKLIMEKKRVTRMTNEAIGAAEEYSFRVPYALRVTNSGEFLHAAPWKEGKGHFGRRNTSHGCVGMSTANARWLYNRVRPGDVTITTGTGRGLEQGNGWSDWDISFKQYKKGSAL